MTAQLDRERSVGIFQALRCVTPLPVDVQKEERDGGKRRRMRDEKIKEVKPKMTDVSIVTSRVFARFEANEWGVVE